MTNKSLHNILKILEHSLLFKDWDVPMIVSLHPTPLRLRALKTIKNYGN